MLRACLQHPLRIAIANDYEIVVVGIAGVLQRFSDRIEVVELDSGVPVRSEVDLVLYDSFGQPQGAALDVPAVLGESGAKVVIFSWNTQPELVEQSLCRGRGRLHLQERVGRGAGGAARADPRR